MKTVYFFTLQKNNFVRYNDDEKCDFYFYSEERLFKNKMNINCFKFTLKFILLAYLYLNSFRVSNRDPTFKIPD